LISILFVDKKHGLVTTSPDLSEDKHNNPIEEIEHSLTAKWLSIYLTNVNLG